MKYGHFYFSFRGEFFFENILPVQVHFTINQFFAVKVFLFQIIDEKGEW